MNAKRMTTREKIRNLQNVRKTGTLTPADQGIAAAIRDNQNAHDEENPDFLLRGVWTSLLVKIAKGEVDVQELAKKELAGRGLNCNGRAVDQEWANQNTNFHWDRNTNTWMYVPER